MYKVSKPQTKILKFTIIHATDYIEYTRNRLKYEKVWLHMKTLDPALYRPFDHASQLKRD